MNPTPQTTLSGPPLIGPVAPHLLSRLWYWAEHEPDTTNNRMELRALVAALDLVPEGTPARIYTDSNLAVRTLTEWAAGWERRGWRRKTGPVENLDLVRPLYERVSARPELELKWIKAHAGNRWNEYADALATAWAREEL